MIKAVIFDCFGVLVGKGFEHTYRTAGGDPESDRDFISDILGQANWGMISDEEFRSKMAQKIGISTDEWRAAVKSAELADQAMLEFVKSLRGEYKTAILSNANKGVLERKIGSDRLKECFDQVVVSADVGMIKPNPDIYQYTAELLGVEPEECVFIDDSDVHLQGAQETGMYPILFESLDRLKIKLQELLADPKD